MRDSESFRYREAVDELERMHNSGALVDYKKKIKTPQFFHTKTKQKIVKNCHKNESLA